MDLPFGRSQRFGAHLPDWANVAASGWSLSAITTLSAGEPIVLTAPNQTGSPFINPLPNRTCDGRDNQLSSHIRGSGMLWFDTGCFQVPDVGYFGNSGATALNGPGLNNWGFALQKTLEVAREATRLDLRANMFNLWNHPQFDQPNGNAGAGVNFGRISAVHAPRLIQVAVKLRW